MPTSQGELTRLTCSLADGRRTAFAGEISEFALLGSGGGLARYRVRISHWIWRLAHVRNSRVWQDMSVTDIVDDVFVAARSLGLHEMRDLVNYLCVMLIYKQEQAPDGTIVAAIFDKVRRKEISFDEAMQLLP